MKVQNVSEVMAADPQAPSHARRVVARALENWGHAELGERAVLAVSELVTNAFLYGSGDIVLVVTLGPALRIEVRDQGASMPAQRNYSPTSTTGRGLHLVEHMADRWGTEPVDAGKAVWFEIDTPESSGADTRRGQNAQEAVGGPGHRNGGSPGTPSLQAARAVVLMPAA